MPAANTREERRSNTWNPLGHSLCGIAIAAGLAVTGTASAGGTQHYQDYARVVHVEQLWRTERVSEPMRICHPRNPRQHHNGHHQVRPNQTGRHPISHQQPNGGAIVGAVIGGAIGHHLTRNINGRSNVGATLAAATIGAAVGHNSQQRHRDSSRHSADRQHGRYQYHGDRQRPQRCTTTTQTREVRVSDGYNVTYVYRGNEFQTRTQQHPGRRIPVRVSLSVDYH